MSKNSRFSARFTKTELAGMAIYAAPMLTKQTITVMCTGSLSGNGN